MENVNVNLNAGSIVSTGLNIDIEGKLGGDMIVFKIVYNDEG